MWMCKREDGPPASLAPRTTTGQPTPRNRSLLDVPGPQDGLRPALAAGRQGAEDRHGDGLADVGHVPVDEHHMNAVAVPAERLAVAAAVVVHQRAAVPVRVRGRVRGVLVVV